MDTELYAALDEGDVVKALLAVERAADVNYLYENDFNIIYLLLEGLARNKELLVSREDLPPQPPACFEPMPDGPDYQLNWFRAIKYLTTNPLYRLVQNSSKRTALHTFAIASFDPDAQNMDALCELLAYNRTSEELNLLNKDKHSAFMLAVLQQKPQRLALAKIPGVDVNITLTANQPLVHLITVLPEDVKARVKYWGGGELILPSRFSPFMMSCLFRDKDLFTILIHRTDLVGQAAEYLRPFVDPEVGICRRIDPGDTHVHHAVTNNDIDFLKIALKIIGPAALQCVNALGETVLHKACFFSQADVILLLLSKVELRKIFQQDLTDELYHEFVNRVSSEEATGRAASCFAYYPKVTRLESFNIFKAFLLCEDYDIMDRDQSGNSLLHILIENAHAELVPLAATRKNTDFSMKNVMGETPLQIAIKSKASCSVEVIEEMAKLKTRPDLDPNKNIDSFVNLRSKLIELRRVFGTQVGSYWDVDKIIVLFIEKKPFEFNLNKTEPYLQATVRRTDGLSDDDRIGLERDFTECLSEIFNKNRGLSHPFVRRTSPTPRPEGVYEIIKEKYFGTPNGTFCYLHNDINLEVDYVLGERVMDYTLEFTYVALIKEMGNEWDLLENSDSSKQLPRGHVQFLSHTPSLYLLLLQIKEAVEAEQSLPNATEKNVPQDDAGAEETQETEVAEAVKNLPECVHKTQDTIVTEKEKVENDVVVDTTQKSLALRKLAAFLLFRQITIQTAEDVTAGQINMLKFAREFTCPEAVDLLKNKLITQVSGAKVDQEDCAEVVYTIDYNELRRTDLHPYDDWQTCAEFAELFCTRLNSATAYRTYTQVGPLSRLLDSMARFLDVSSVCAAVCFVNDEFIISSNFGARGDDKEKRSKVRKHVQETAEKLFRYASDCVTKKYTLPNELQRSVKILESVLRLELRNALDNAGKMRGEDEWFAPILENETNFRQLIEYCYFNSNMIFVTKNETGEMIFTGAYDFVKTNFLLAQLPIENQLEHKQKTTNERDDPFKSQMGRTVHTIWRLARDLRRIGDGMRSGLFTRAMIKAFCEEKFQILPNTDGVHAETALITHIATSGISDIPQIYVGISKVCCVHCSLFIQSFNNRSFSDEDIFFATRGSHVTHYSWTIPKFLVDNVDKLAVFLGEAYPSFVALDDKKKIIALKLVEDISVDTLQAKLSALQRDVKKAARALEKALQLPHSENYLQFVIDAKEKFEATKTSFRSEEYRNKLESTIASIDTICSEMKILEKLLTTLQQKQKLHSRAEPSVSQVDSIPDAEEDFQGEDDAAVDNDVEDEWFEAIRNSKVSKLHELLQSEASMIDVNRREPFKGQTALHVAVTELDGVLAEKLIRRGAKITVKNKQGKSPDDLMEGYSFSTCTADTPCQAIIELFHSNEVAERKTLFESNKVSIRLYKENHIFHFNYDQLEEITIKYHYYRSDRPGSPTCSIGPINRECALKIMISSIDHMIVYLMDLQMHSYVFTKRAATLLRAISAGAWHCQFRDSDGALPGTMWRLFVFLFVCESKRDPEESLGEFLRVCLCELQATGALESWRNALEEYLGGNRNVDTTVPHLHSVLSFIADDHYMNYIEYMITSYKSQSVLSPPKQRSRWLSYVVRIGQALEDGSDYHRRRFDTEKVVRTINLSHRIIYGDIAASVLEYIRDENDENSLEELAKYWTGQLVHIKSVNKDNSNKRFHHPKDLWDTIKVTPDLLTYNDIFPDPLEFDPPLSSLLRLYMEYALEVKTRCVYNRSDNRQVILGYVFEAHARHPDDDVIEMHHLILASLAKVMLKPEKLLSPDTLRDTFRIIIDNSKVLVPDWKKIRPAGRFFRDDEEQRFKKYYANCDLIINSIEAVKAALNE